MIWSKDKILINLEASSRIQTYKWLQEKFNK